MDLADNWGFPGGSDRKESACNAGDLGLSLSQEDTLENGMATTPVFLLEEFHGHGSLAGCSPCSHKESLFSFLEATVSGRNLSNPKKKELELGRYQDGEESGVTHTSVLVCFVLCCCSLSGCQLG